MLAKARDAQHVVVTKESKRQTVEKSKARSTKVEGGTGKGFNGYENDAKTVESGQTCGAG